MRLKNANHAIFANHDFIKIKSCEANHFWYLNKVAILPYSETPRKVSVSVFLFYFSVELILSRWTTLSLCLAANPAPFKGSFWQSNLQRCQSGLNLLLKGRSTETPPVADTVRCWEEETRSSADAPRKAMRLCFWRRWILRSKRRRIVILLLFFLQQTFLCIRFVSA